MVNALLFVSEYNPEGLGPLLIEEKERNVLVESTEDYVYVIGVLHNSTTSEEKRNQNITA